MTDKILFTDKERVESNQSILDELEARVTRIEEKIDGLTSGGDSFVSEVSKEQSEKVREVLEKAIEEDGGD